MSDRGNQDYSPAVRRATTVALPLPIKSIMKRDCHGHEHIPRSGGVIVAANHLSYADWAAMALFVHEAGRYPAFLIKSTAFNVKGVGPFLRAAGQFPVNRGTARPPQRGAGYSQRPSHGTPLQHCDAVVQS